MFLGDAFAVQNSVESYPPATRENPYEKDEHGEEYKSDVFRSTEPWHHVEGGQREGSGTRRHAHGSKYKVSLRRRFDLRSRPPDVLAEDGSPS